MRRRWGDDVMRNVLLGLILFATPSLAAGNLITNGDFSQGLSGWSGYGWDVSDPFGTGNNVAAGLNVFYPGISLGQQVPLNVGGRYVASYKLGGGANYNPTTISVSLGDAQQNYSLSSGSALGRESFEFTASQSLEKIVFHNDCFGCAAVYLDDVAIEPVQNTIDNAFFHFLVDGRVLPYYGPGPESDNWGAFVTRYGLADKYPQDLKELVGSDFLQSGMGAAFVPKFALSYSIKDVAAFGGYDHFNWIQVYSPSPDGPYSIDPSLGCYESLPHACPNRDLLPWYLDEQFTIDGIRVLNPDGSPAPGADNLMTRLQSWTTADGGVGFKNELLFSDSPNVSGSFATCLVGVHANGTGQIISPSDCFRWSNTASGTIGTEWWGGDGVIGPVNFFDPNSSADAMLFAKLETLAGGVPEPSTWALMLSGFGLVGFAARRRKPVVALTSA